MLMTSPSRKYRKAMSPEGVSMTRFLLRVSSEIPRAAKNWSVLGERGRRFEVSGRFATSAFLLPLMLTRPLAELLDLRSVLPAPVE